MELKSYFSFVNILFVNNSYELCIIMHSTLWCHNLKHRKKPSSNNRLSNNRATFSALKHLHCQNVMNSTLTKNNKTKNHNKMKIYKKAINKLNWSGSLSSGFSVNWWWEFYFSVLYVVWCLSLNYCGNVLECL